MQPTNQLQSINRQTWKSIVIKPNPIPIFVFMSMIGFLGSVLLIFLSFVFAELEIFGYFIIITLIALISFVITFTIQFLNYSSRRYILLPAQIKKINNEILDQTPGRLEYTFGLFTKVKQMFPLSEFERVWVFQPPLGKIFNYGHVHLEQTDKLEETKDYVMKNIPSPEKAAKIIQDLIDLEQNQATPF